MNKVDDGRESRKKRGRPTRKKQSKGRLSSGVSISRPTKKKCRRDERTQRRREGRYPNPGEGKKMRKDNKSSTFSLFNVNKKEKGRLKNGWCPSPARKGVANENAKTRLSGVRDSKLKN